METIVDMFEFGMAKKLPIFAQFPKGKIINVGAGNKHIQGVESIDLPDYDADEMPLPFNSGTIAGIHAYHFLEHVIDPIKMLREFERVLMHNGCANILVPYYTSQNNIQDLDHKSVWCEDTWKNTFFNAFYDKKGKWKFRIGINLIMGIVERNLILCTQLIKEEL